MKDIFMMCFNSVISFCWYYITSVTCFNSVISFCWYYIIASVTCFNSVISFCWYYILTSVTCFNSVISFCWYYILASVTCLTIRNAEKSTEYTRMQNIRHSSLHWLSILCNLVPSVIIRCCFRYQNGPRQNLFTELSIFGRQQFYLVLSCEKSNKDYFFNRSFGVVVEWSKASNSGSMVVSSKPRSDISVEGGLSMLISIVVATLVV